MPHFARSDEYYSVSYITGPSHVLLQLAFAPVPVSDPQLIELPAVGNASHRTIDPQQIRSAVIDAAQATNAELGSSFYPATIRYVADDSPRYQLYAYCTALLIRRLAAGEAFGQPE